jgi:hypothetical protein
MTTDQLARAADLLDHLVAELEGRRVSQGEALAKALELVACQREVLAELDGSLDRLKFDRARLARTMVQLEEERNDRKS